MKITRILGVAMLLLIGSCDTHDPAAEQVSELDSMAEKISYAIGFNTARELKRDGIVLDAEALAAAIKHVNQESPSLLSEDEMQAAMTAFQAQVQEQRQRMFAQNSANNLADGQAFLQRNAQREGVVTTGSGLQYEVVQAGVGESPAASDQVVVNYRGYFIAGELFESGNAVTLRLTDPIAAWAEALQGMKVGAKWNIYAPPHLAYGESGSGRVGPNQTVIYEMELLSILDAED